MIIPTSVLEVIKENEEREQESILSKYSVRQLIKLGKVNNNWLLNLYEGTDEEVKEKLVTIRKESGLSIKDFCESKGITDYFYKKCCEELGINMIFVPRSKFMKDMKKIVGYEERRKYFKNLLRQCSNIDEVREDMGLKETNFMSIYLYGIIFRIDIYNWNFHNGDSNKKFGGKTKIMRDALLKYYVFSDQMKFDIDLEWIFKKINKERLFTLEELRDFMKKEHPDNIHYVKEEQKFVCTGLVNIIDSFKMFEKKCMHRSQNETTKVEDVIDAYLSYANIFPSNTSVKHLLTEFCNCVEMPFVWNDNVFDEENRYGIKAITCKYLRLHDSALDSEKKERVEKKKEIDIAPTPAEEKFKETNKSLGEELLELAKDPKVKRFLTLLLKEETWEN